MKIRSLVAWWATFVIGLQLLLVSASAAVACVPQPRLVSLVPMASGPSGMEVTVNGLGFDPGRAEVRWNGPEGELLATGNGQSFSLPIMIPDVPAGLYSVVVLSRDVDGGIGNTGTASFQVVSGAAPEADEPSTSGQVGGRADNLTAVEETSNGLGWDIVVALTGAGMALLFLGALFMYLLNRRQRNCRSLSVKG